MAPHTFITQQSESRELTIERDGTMQTQSVDDAAALGGVLSEFFGLTLTASELDAAFRVAVGEK